MELEIMLNCKWVSYSFLPFYSIRKASEVKAKECAHCLLAYKCHPHHFVEDGSGLTGIKYCTKDFLKNLGTNKVKLILETLI